MFLFFGTKVGVNDFSHSHHNLYSLSKKERGIADISAPLFCYLHCHGLFGATND